MLRRTLLLAFLVAGSAASRADEAAADKAASPAAAEAAQVAAVQPKPDAAGSKTLSGISILGNQEAPKALVIVPWKSSQLGDSLGIAKSLDDGRQPIDKDVFMRQLSYYEIRANSK